MPAAKLVVTGSKGGSQITLVGSSGTPLLTSKVFSEPRGKGATLRALKGLLGESVVVDDQTVAAPKAVAAAPRPRQREITKPVAPANGSSPKASRPRRTRKAK